ncbi:E3 ubiquitin-protein ligase UPL5 [Abeliophyllum distichum]|uniref:E3 ubiquitin-protein ligase UPL5 n=1 Tax=Abeliophyllum distichum TaxID=126358 RepID=A0ABD1QHL8_9LAMI
MSSSHSKRKLEDYVDEFFSISPCPVAARMRKDQTALPSSSNSPLSYLPRSSLTESTSSHTRLQFFVRMLSERTLVLQADCTDTIKSIHEKIQSIIRNSGHRAALNLQGETVAVGEDSG